MRWRQVVLADGSTVRADLNGVSEDETVEVALEGGGRLMVPAAWLVEEDDERCALDLRLPADKARSRPPGWSISYRSIPVAAESLRITKKTIEEPVLLRKRVQEHEERVEAQMDDEDVGDRAASRES